MQTRRDWTCPKCNNKNNYLTAASSSSTCRKCGLSHLGREFPTLKSLKCPNCQQELDHGANFCPACQAPVRPLDLQGRLLKCQGATSWPFHIFTVTETVVISKPEPNAERLVVVGKGDSLPLAKREDDPGDFREVLVHPLGIIGYVGKSTGVVVDVGHAVDSNLGFATNNYWLKKANGGTTLSGDHVEITSIQPDGSRIPVTGDLGDGCPIVEESESEFKIQLPSGVQGWVHKSRVIRKLSPSSLPVPKSDDSPSLLGAVLGAVVLGGLGAMSNAVESDRLSNSVAEGIRRASR